MAVAWLDLARYADTHGYHSDSQREMWRWRDWVLQAFANNMPFDRFTVEQIAGDMLPNATIAEVITYSEPDPVEGALPRQSAVCRSCARWIR